MKPYEPFQDQPSSAAGAHPVIRFLTAGSVDDGKSTLIGRLLYDCKAVLVDQVTAIERAKYKRTEAGVLDLSLLTDGLEAEREQGITIDVAYRYFSNGRAKFIIADAPGHEQYTRNMVTAASNSEAVVLLIDPTRVRINDQGDAELLPQTRRHAAIAALLGLRHVVVAVNKMDRVGYQQTAFEPIRAAALALAEQLGLPTPEVIPLSALNGDNVVLKGTAMSWYRGPTLLAWLQGLASQGAGSADIGGPTPNGRFLVQRVQRLYGATAAHDPLSQVDGWRGLQGVLTQGSLNVGDQLMVLPAQAAVTVASIRTLQAELTSVVTGDRQSVGTPLTLTLRENVDVARGDVLESVTGREALTQPSHQLEADLCWLDTAALSPSKRYWLQMGTARVQAKVSSVMDTLDLTQLLRVPATQPSLTMNQIGRVRITLGSPLVARPQQQPAAAGTDPSLSRFILVDASSHQTAAAGLVRTASA